MILKNIVDSLKSLWTSLTNAETDITNLKKVTREVLFDDAENTSKTIKLNDSAYNYSYLYVDDGFNYNVIIPIYDSDQTELRGVGAWTGAENGGTNHFYGDLSNAGKTLNVTYFRSLVHNAAGNHNDGADRNVLKVIGVK